MWDTQTIAVITFTTFVESNFTVLETKLFTPVAQRKRLRPLCLPFLDIPRRLGQLVVKISLSGITEN
jgi:hypothetical protein